MNVFTTEHAQPGRRGHHLLQVFRHDAAVLRVGVERVRIIAQAGDGHAVPLRQVAHPAGVVVAEVRHVQVRHAGVAAVGPARRPAHQLHAGEALVAREAENLFQS